ncbi:MAG: GAF domain-containing protein [Candidatus Omnitrophota bacterium]|jgi:ligand-binding sensor protein/putative methionine-R-sulfoxide reductase with GAF domain|nr:MAG: GAF domain-containing protein [Candidatus Omnitrophota bacterium]
MAENNNPRWHRLSFEDLINLKEWQVIQDNFSAITNVTIRTLDVNGKPLTTPSSEPRLCRELIKDIKIKDEICGLCLPSFLGGKAHVDKNLTFLCRADLRNFIAPLRIDGKVVGYVLVGPLVLVMRKPKDEYRKVAEELNIEFEKFWNAFIEIKVTSFFAAQSMIEVIKNVAEYSLNLSYEKFKNEALSVNPLRSPNLLDALLEVASQVSQADIGSVMMLNADTNEFTIEAAKGLSEDVVRKTRVSLGHGISGIVAESGKPLVIDDKIQNDRLRGLLQRPQLGSSMIIPIKSREKVQGVMNLAAFRDSGVRFDMDKANLVKNLIDLATIAIN